MENRVAAGVGLDRSQVKMVRVGAGKTYTMTAAAMELKRLGACQKTALLCAKPHVGLVFRRTILIR